jgi:hypothetical protein
VTQPAAPQPVKLPPHERSDAVIMMTAKDYFAGRDPVMETGVRTIGRD